MPGLHEFRACAETADRLGLAHEAALARRKMASFTEATAAELQLDTAPPTLACAACCFEEFKVLVASNATAFAQKRALCEALQEFQGVFVDRSEKLEWLNKQMDAMVTNGNLTHAEITHMAAQLEARSKEMKQSIAQLKAETARKEDLLSELEAQVAHLRKLSVDASRK